jgi:hypothetical protein
LNGFIALGAIEAGAAFTTRLQFNSRWMPLFLFLLRWPQKKSALEALKGTKISPPLSPNVFTGCKNSARQNQEWQQWAMPFSLALL